MINDHRDETIELTFGPVKVRPGDTVSGKTIAVIIPKKHAIGWIEENDNFIYYVSITELPTHLERLG